MSATGPTRAAATFTSRCGASRAGTAAGPRSTRCPTCSPGTSAPNAHGLKSRVPFVAERARIGRSLSMRPAWDGSRRLGMAGRAVVGLEIVVEYGRVRRDLRRMGVSDAMAAVTRPAEADDARERTIAFRIGRAVDLTLSALPSDPRCLIRAVVLSRVLA